MATEDDNADLIGYTYKAMQGDVCVVYTVTGRSWSIGYVAVDVTYSNDPEKTYPTVRSAKLVRRHKELGV